MANDNLSGMVVLTSLAQYVASKKRRYKYRFLLSPETIGPITYLASSYGPGYMLQHLKNKLVAGWVMTCLGGPGDFTLQLGKGRNKAEVISEHVLINLGMGFKGSPWRNRASDERQFCSPNVDLPVVTILKTHPSEYKEYHTNADNLDFVKPRELETSLAVYKKIVDSLELDRTYRTTIVGEPFMSKRGDLYPVISQKGSSMEVRDLMNLWSYCDGSLSTVEIANKLGMSIWQMEPLINILVKNELIYEV